MFPYFQQARLHAYNQPILQLKAARSMEYFGRMAVDESNLSVTAILPATETLENLLEIHSTTTTEFWIAKTNGRVVGLACSGG